uniref:Uncharacterized protein n=1 Tax=Arundo donax TaxID=35708 RepID=A0A0A9DHG8_ARUDO
MKRIGLVAMCSCLVLLILQCQLRKLENMELKIVSHRMESICGRCCYD